MSTSASSRSAAQPAGAGRSASEPAGIGAAARAWGQREGLTLWLGHRVSCPIPRCAPWLPVSPFPPNAKPAALAFPVAQTSTDCVRRDRPRRSAMQERTRARQSPVQTDDKYLQAFRIVASVGGIVQCVRRHFGQFRISRYAGPNLETRSKEFLRNAKLRLVPVAMRLDFHRRHCALRACRRVRRSGRSASGLRRLQPAGAPFLRALRDRFITLFRSIRLPCSKRVL